MNALVLRAWRDADWAALVEAYRDPQLRRWTRVPVTSQAEARTWIDLQRNTPGRECFAVDEGARLAGTVVLKRDAQTAGSAEVGFCTAAACRGRGIAPQAVGLLTGWAFDRYPEFERLELLHDVRNLASCRVAEKSGYAFAETITRAAETGHRHQLAR